MKVLNAKELAAVFGGNFFLRLYPSGKSVHILEKGDAKQTVNNEASMGDTHFFVYPDIYPSNAPITIGADRTVRVKTEKGIHTTKLKEIVWN